MNQLIPYMPKADSAKDIFLKSGLSVDILGKVWSLGDPTGTGKIQENQFIACMGVLQKLRQGVLTSVPTSFPQLLWTSVAKGDIVPPVGTPASTTSTQQVPPVESLQTLVADLPWAVPESDKRQFYAFFDKLDKKQTGFITGEQGYSFFLKSKLPETHLAQVWDLSDIQKAGKLSKDEFALAMFLIKEKMAGKELPIVLPIEYVPPALRPLMKQDPLPSAAASALKQEENLLMTPVSTTPAQSSIVDPLASMILPPVAMNPDRLELEALSLEQSNILQTVNELQGKKGLAQKELEDILSQKKNIQEQIAHLKAVYEAELLSLSEAQGSLTREKVALESTQKELELLKQTKTSLEMEKKLAEEELVRVQQENVEAKKMIQEFTEMEKSARQELERIRGSIRQGSQYLEMNQKLAASASMEARNLVMEVNALKQQGMGGVPPSFMSTPISSQQQQPPAFVPSSGSPAQVAGVVPSPGKADDLDDPFAGFRQDDPSQPKKVPPPVPSSAKPGARSEVSASPSIGQIDPQQKFSVASLVSNPGPKPVVDQSAKDEIDALLFANKPKKGKQLDAKQSFGSINELGLGEQQQGFVPQFSGPTGPGSVKSLTLSLMDERVTGGVANVNSAQSNRPPSVKSMPYNENPLAAMKQQNPVVEENLEFPSFGQVAPFVQPADPTNGFETGSVKASSIKKGIAHINADAEFQNAFNLEDMSPAVTTPAGAKVPEDVDLDAAFSFDNYNSFSKPQVKGVSPSQSNVTSSGTPMKPVAPPQQTQSATQVTGSFAAKPNSFNIAFDTAEFPGFPSSTSGSGQGTAAAVNVPKVVTDADLDDAFSVGNTGPPSSANNRVSIAGALTDPFGGLQDWANRTLKALTELGFTKAESMEALEATGGDLQKATNYLLDKKQ
jgi:hypothetical protein